MANWKKIEDLGDFSKMKKNTPLIKYTGNGTPDFPVPTFDKSYNTYTVTEVKSDKIDIQIAPAEISSSVGVVSRGALHKELQAMIDEKEWWYLPA